MPLDFLSLSRRASNNIWDFVDHEAPLVMRTVSKSMKEHVDTVLRTFKRNYIYELRLGPSTETNGTVSSQPIVIKFIDEKICSLWKVCIVSKLGRAGLISNIETGIFYAFKLYLSSTIEVLTFFKHMEMVVRRSTFGMVDFCRVKTVILRCCLDTWRSTKVKSISLRPRADEEFDFSRLLSNMKHWATSTFHAYNLPINKDTESFLLQSADILSTSLLIADVIPHRNFPISFILALIRRKVPSISFSNHVLELKDVEKVVQTLHRTDTTKFFTAKTNGQPINVAIGVCNVKTFRSKLRITHNFYVPVLYDA